MLDKRLVSLGTTDSSFAELTDLAHRTTRARIGATSSSLSLSSTTACTRVLRMWSNTSGERCSAFSMHRPADLTFVNSENIYIVKTLKEFQFIDEFGKDQGANGSSRLRSLSRSLADSRYPQSVRRRRTSPTFSLTSLG